MTSSKKKGASKELMCKHELVADGWLVGFKSHTCKRGNFFQANDFFNLFDLVAVKERTWRFISVTHAGAKSKPEEIGKIAKFKEIYGVQGMVFELWLWHKSRHFGRGVGKKWVTAHFERMVV